METIKSNILNMISGEYDSTFKLAGQAVAGFESAANNTAETKIAHQMFNAIIRYVDSRTDINRALNHLISTCTSEQARLQQGRTLDLGWINSSQFEEAVQSSKKWEHEINTLAYLIGLTGNERNDLFKKIQDLTNYSI